MKNKKSEVETFSLGNKYAEILKRAIDDVCRETMVYNDSITFESEKGDTTLVKIEPTHAMCLFNFFGRYGKYVKQAEFDAQHK
jgi:hypothetical protein